MVQTSTLPFTRGQGKDNASGHFDDSRPEPQRGRKGGSLLLCIFALPRIGVGLACWDTGKNKGIRYMECYLRVLDVVTRLGIQRRVPVPGFTCHLLVTAYRHWTLPSSGISYSRALPTDSLYLEVNVTA